MSKTKTITRMLGVATLAMMFGTGAAWAANDNPKEGPKNAAGETAANRAGQMSPTGANDPASVKAAPVGKSEAAAAKSGTSGSSGSSSASGTSGASGKLSRADEKIMKEMAYSNISEIAAGKLAQTKSSNEQVKSFAQKMVDDHTKAQQELEQLAQTKGVTLPTEPDAKHKAAAKMMEALSADKFDKAYMKQGGLNDHRNTHKLLSNAQRKASDPDLKALVAKTAPVVDQHLSMAKDIHGDKAAGNMSGSSMGSAGTSGKSDTGASGSTSGNSTSSGTSSTSSTKNTGK